MMTGLYYLSLDANGTAGLFWEEWVGVFYIIKTNLRAWEHYSLYADQMLIRKLPKMIAQDNTIHLSNLKVYGLR